MEEHKASASPVGYNLSSPSDHDMSSATKVTFRNAIEEGKYVIRSKKNLLKSFF